MNWISVEDKDKLPEELDEILFTEGQGVYKGYRIEYDLGEERWNAWFSVSDNKIDDVTHWMPLPELPK